MEDFLVVSVDIGAVTEKRLTACVQFQHEGQEAPRHVKIATVLAVPHDELTKFGTFPCSFNPALCDV